MIGARPGDVVRVIGGPWPERIGLTGVVVGPPDGPPVYPWADLGGSKWAVVLLADDPFAERAKGRSWSCVMAVRDLDRVRSEAEVAAVRELLAGLALAPADPERSL